MNIITDVNKSIEPLAGLNGAGEETSILSSLFSISFSSEEIVSKNDLIDKEFLFEDDEIKIIDYISNIIPDFESKKNSFSDLSEVNNTIKLDTNLSETEKNKILNVIKLVLTSPKEIKLEISGNKNFKSLVTEKPLKSNKNSMVNVNPVNNKKDKINLNNFKNINIFNINDGKTDNKQEEKVLNVVQNQQGNNKKLPLNDQPSSFVKKIKKNTHPNKIYHLAKVSIVEQNQSNFLSSQYDTKSSNNILVNQFKSQITDIRQKNKTNETKNNNNETKNNNNENLNFQQSNQINNTTNNYSHNGSASFSNNGYNSVLENFLDNLDLTQKGWTSKLVSRIENSLVDGGGEIEFNLKPKNLGMLKVSVILKEGIGNVKIIAENSFATIALNQNENHLQKLFNDQGINLEFSAKSENQNFGSQNSFNQNSNNKKESKDFTTKKDVEVIDESKTGDNSSRHIINVIA